MVVTNISFITYLYMERNYVENYDDYDYDDDPPRAAHILMETLKPGALLW